MWKSSSSSKKWHWLQVIIGLCELWHFKSLPLKWKISNRSFCFTEISRPNLLVYTIHFRVKLLKLLKLVLINLVLLEMFEAIMWVNNERVDRWLLCHVEPPSLLLLLANVLRRWHQWHMVLRAGLLRVLINREPMGICLLILGLIILVTLIAKLLFKQLGLLERGDGLVLILIVVELM